MKTPPKPVKITGSATGNKAVNFKDTQKINKTATKVVARTEGGISNSQVQPTYRETGVTITGTATASQPSAAAIARFNKMNKYKMGNR
jgi:hypothetical protein